MNFVLIVLQLLVALTLIPWWNFWGKLFLSLRKGTIKNKNVLVVLVLAVCLYPFVLTASMYNSWEFINMSMTSMAFIISLLPLLLFQLTYLILKNLKAVKPIFQK